MKPDRRFIGLGKDFWANVRLIGQQVGYTARKTSQVKVPAPEEIKAAYEGIGLTCSHLFDDGNKPTAVGRLLLDYFLLRAKTLNEYAEPRLMDAPAAKRLFEAMKKEYKPKCPLPMNKQSGKKKTPAFLTSIINMIVEANSAGASCDYDPRKLTTITADGRPLRTLARRIDGAFPSSINPVAVWEIKEYYYTTTFGSRVADGVYESLLDGMELEELLINEKIDIKHYLFVDSHFTWWDCGRSYLCRLLDLLHMGYADEILFGKEVIERLPALVKGWVELAKARGR